MLTALLDDRVRTVRLEAVGQLVTIDGPPTEQQARGAFDRAADEFRQSQAANAERAEAQVTLGAFEARLGRVDLAEAAYRTAISLQPQFAPAYVNLADLLRAVGRDVEGSKSCARGWAWCHRLAGRLYSTRSASNWRARKRYGDAVVLLRLATEGDAGNAR